MTFEKLFVSIMITNEVLMDLISDLNGIAESKVIKNVNLAIIYKRISLQKNELKV